MIIASKDNSQYYILGLKAISKEEKTIKAQKSLEYFFSQRRDI
jgi:hypothetical protein